MTEGSFSHSRNILPPLKVIFIIFVWLPSIYIILFLIGFYLHVNESNIIANRANALVHSLTYRDDSALVKVAGIQTMKAVAMPSIFEPMTVFNSLLGERQVYQIADNLLKEAIEKLKENLEGSPLYNLDLSAIDLSRARLDGADLTNAKLNEADLSEAGLINVSLNGSDLRGANLFKAKLFLANLTKADLRGANLKHVKNLTCDQIQSAVIDKNTRLPDYIYLTGSPDSSYECKNLFMGEGMDLQAANLAKADLRHANLSKANLSRANLYEAYLYQTQLNEADLSEANLRNAHLMGSDLDQADLTKADLRGANLKRVKNLSCDQIKSAVIDKNTRLPDYIYLTGSPDSSYECENKLGIN